MELQELRSQIDQIDDEMLELFLRRLGLSEEIASYKNEHGLPVLNRERERAVLAEMMEKGGDDKELYVYRFFSILMDISKARQAELISGESKIGAFVREMLSHEETLFPKTGMIACQGVEGGNSQEACDRLFPRGSILYVKSFEAVFQAVQSGLCKFGVVPIENSSNGSVRSVYALMQKYHFSIVRSTRQWIHHTLLAKPGTKLGDIKTIYSHEQALGQCSGYLEKNSSIKTVSCANTALAAKMVAEDTDGHCAAIASKRCAELYGLEILDENIQDSDNNYTRFVCITKDPIMYEGADHISLIVSCAHKPGALHEMLSKPAALGVNMIMLESCPVAGRNFEFDFFVELEASLKERGVISMLEDLERTNQEITFLGNYTEV